MIKSLAVCRRTSSPKLLHRSPVILRDENYCRMEFFNSHCGNEVTDLIIDEKRYCSCIVGNLRHPNGDPVILWKRDLTEIGIRQSFVVRAEYRTLQ